MRIPQRPDRVRRVVFARVRESIAGLRLAGFTEEGRRGFEIEGSRHQEKDVERARKTNHA